jgi:glycosyltransferase involved in cell wall biosynthesis
VNPIEMKGAGYLIQAVKGLVPEHKNLKLVIVGDGDARAKHERMAGSIQENVIFTGFRNDVCNLMSAADVFVLPSLSEGCPVVVLEASACGVPVIATGVGGVPDLVDNGNTGIVVKPRSVAELSQAILQMMGNPDLRSEMGRKGRERIEQRFTWDTTCSKLEEFYSELIERKNKDIARD